MSLTSTNTPTNGAEIVDFPTPVVAANKEAWVKPKTLDDINWDTALGTPHGVVGDNGVREPRDSGREYIKEGRALETNDLARYKDKINPDHYKKGDVEVIQLTEKLGFCEGNIVKYVARYKDKGGKDDLLKARWYLDRLISQL